jgi:predicted DNA binding CopG/RHH family protein
MHGKLVDGLPGGTSMNNPKRVDPFDALNDEEFDAEVARLLNASAPSVSVSLRIPILMLERIKSAAQRAGLPYQTFTKRLIDMRLERLEWNEGLQMGAPRDLAQARSWLKDQRPRLAAWAVDALATRLRGHVLQESIPGLVDAVVEYRVAGNHRRAAVRLDDLPYGTFQKAFASLGCSEGYIIYLTAPTPAREKDAAIDHVYYEGLADLIDAVSAFREGRFRRGA